MKYTTSTDSAALRGKSFDTLEESLNAYGNNIYAVWINRDRQDGDNKAADYKVDYTIYGRKMTAVVEVLVN